MKYIVVVLAVIGFVIGCGNDVHFVSDAKFRAEMESDFELKRQLLSDSVLSDFMNDKSLGLEEREALMFLYAYMPVGDAVDNDYEFFVDNVRTTLKSRNEMEWGRRVPELEFRHFVLPIRVNNESLDSSRMVFYRELKDRVKGMSMYDAALEINHWCHEKVVYMPSDARTSSPLASVRTAYGRCGEESTFAVAALRAMSIPARQVYTPRWAHCDDNHAWVEVWIDGQWYYMGACEPEPKLNMGWFSSPSQRAMLVHTKVFGKYWGKEDVISETPCFTEINVIENYAPAKMLKVRIVDAEGNPIEGADVAFGLYNYAEYYHIIRKSTDSAGMAGITSGRGDLMISAYNRRTGMYGYGVYPADQTEVMDIVVNRLKGGEYEEQFDLFPPAERQVNSDVTDEMRAANNDRLKCEDDIRNEYVATFVDQRSANELAVKLGVDSVAMWNYLKASRGNYGTIIDFLVNTTAENRSEGMDLLGAVSQKDLRDITGDVLVDNIANTKPNGGYDRDVYVNYVLNPRVENEQLTTYKGFINNNLKVANVEQALSYVRGIKPLEDKFTQRLAVSPEGVIKLGVADKRSRDILFVAICRSIGVPARLEPVTKQVEYFDGKQWIGVNFENNNVTTGNCNKGYLKLVRLSKEVNPAYYIDFALAKYNDKGEFVTLEFEDDAKFENVFGKPILLDEGYYRLITGNRMISGSVLVNATYFNINKDETTDVVLSIRKSNAGGKVFANMSLDLDVKVDNKDHNIGKELSRGNFIMAVVDPNKEPTNHLLKEIEKHKATFADWNRPIYLLFTSDDNLKLFRNTKHVDLPANVILGVDDKGMVINEIARQLSIKDVEDRPILVFATHEGGVSYSTQGYKIGVGEQLVKIIKGE